MSELEDRINSLLSSPEEMEKIAKLAQSLMGDLGSSAVEKEEGRNQESPLDGLLGGIDPGMIAAIGRAMSDSGQSDKTKLLSALSPYLGEKRREKMTKAIHIARVAKLAGAVFSESGGFGGV